MSFACASVRKRLSCVLPFSVTATYSIIAFVMLITAGKVTERDCLSSRTWPISKTPEEICLMRERFVDWENAEVAIANPIKNKKRIQTDRINAVTLLEGGGGQP